MGIDWRKMESIQTYSERIARETLLNNAKGTPEGRHEGERM